MIGRRMKVIKYPETIDKKTFLDEYSARLLECLKISMESSFPQTLTLTPEADDSWYKYLNINLDKGVRYRILEDDARIRGYLVWFYNDDEVQIYDLIIHPYHQCDGSTLRNLLLIFAKDIRYSGFSKLIAYTNSKNDRMNRLLIKRGFTVRQVRSRGTEYYIDLKQFLIKFKDKK